MSRTQWIGGLAASAVAVGAMVVGGGTAFAATPSPTPPPPVGSNQRVCNERIPQLLARIDKVTARINADAGTKGSTAWLQARETEARSTGRTALADLIQVRISHRPERLAELVRAKVEVQKVQSQDCGSGS